MKLSNEETQGKVRGIRPPPASRRPDHTEKPPFRLLDGKGHRCDPHRVVRHVARIVRSGWYFNPSPSYFGVGESRDQVEDMRAKKMKTADVERWSPAISLPHLITESGRFFRPISAKRCDDPTPLVPCHFPGFLRMRRARRGMFL
jgi:hypothetical protein